MKIGNANRGISGSLGVALLSAGRL